MFSNQLFLTLLFMFAAISSLITEVIKKIVSDKKNLSYNLTTLIVAMVVGCGGCFVYYIMKDIDITLKNTIFAILMGGASGMCATLGYDKVVQTIEQFGTKEENEYE